LHNNCLAPVVHVLLKEGYGIDDGLMTTIHSYTATQKTVDGPSKKTGRGSFGGDQHHSFHHRAPRSGPCLPRGERQAYGHVLRVPTPTVSVVDLTVKTVKDTSYKEICAAMEKASKTYLRGILAYTADEVVSSDSFTTPFEHFRRRQRHRA